MRDLEVMLVLAVGRHLSLFSCSHRGSRIYSQWKWLYAPRTKPSRCLRRRSTVYPVCSGISACGIHQLGFLSKDDYIKSKLKTFETPTDAHTLLVIQPDNKVGRVERPYVPAKRKLEEAVNLVEAISGWSVQSQRIDAVRTPHNETFFGKGKIAELEEFVKSLPVSGVFLNVPQLTVVQHKALEDIFEKKVFDRFGIILKIFKERARTRVAKLQVELAEIPYLLSHVIKPEEHHHEMNLKGESDTALVTKNLRQKEVNLKQELRHIHEHRRLMVGNRKRHHIPIVAIVGYTNAGKTTLTKCLSKDEKMSPEDMLFATLDTTLHAGKLPCGLKVLYLDTIGFISDLPHDLVESFSTTLDDVAHAVSYECVKMDI